MGWWFGRKSAPADVRPFVPAWLQSNAAEEGFLTFEIFGDEGLAGVSDILRDASADAVVCNAQHEVAGYAAYG